MRLQPPRAECSPGRPTPTALQNEKAGLVVGARARVATGAGDALAGRETAVAHLRNGQLTPSDPCQGQSLASYAPLGPHGWFSGGNNTVSFAFPSFLLVFRFRQETAPHHRTTHENGRLEWHPPSPGPQKWCWGVPMRYSGAFLRRSGCVSRHMHHLTGKPGIATGHDPQTPHKPKKRTLPPALCPYQQLYTTYQPRQAPVSQLLVGVGLHSWVSVVLWCIYYFHCVCTLWEPHSLLFPGDAQIDDMT